MYIKKYLHCQKYTKAKNILQACQTISNEVFYIVFIYHNRQNTYFLKSIFVLCRGEEWKIHYEIEAY